MILQKLINSFSKTDDFIKPMILSVKPMTLQKLINSFNKTNDFIKNDKLI